MRHLFLLLAACLALSPRPGPAAAQEARVLRIVAPVEIGGLELARAGVVFARMGVVETLVAADAEGRPVPALAERWSPSSIASSPKISPGPRVARVIARPSECSRVTRKLPTLTM